MLECTHPAQCRVARSRLSGELQGQEIAIPHQGWHANISFAGPAAELAAESFHYEGTGRWSPTQKIYWSHRSGAVSRFNRVSPLDDTTAPLDRFSVRLAALICQMLARYENIQGLHIHTDSY